MEFTVAGEPLCSSQLVADRGPIQPQVPFHCALYTRLLKANGYTGTPSEKSDYDPGFLMDSSTDAILLKELKSIIQEHSTHRPFSILRAVCRDVRLNKLLHRSPPRWLT